MTKLTISTLLGLLIIVAGGIYLFGGGDSQPAEAETLPWVEILKPGVSDGVRQLKTGDELSAPATIKTDGTGLANIHFPDGSVARLDFNTELVLERGSYDGADKTLRVKILLSVGRVWSKILELATPRSSWEVQTANAVATVRGTVFGVEYAGGKTTVVGSEHSVSVTNLERKTSVILLEDQVMTVAGGVTETRAKKTVEAEWVERFESVIAPVSEPRQTETKVESFIAPVIKTAIEPVAEAIIAPTNEATIAPASEPTTSDSIQNIRTISQ